jgi:AraC-like DNA-binding protein
MCIILIVARQRLGNHAPEATVIRAIHAILHHSHHLLNVLLQIANKLGLSNKKTEELFDASFCMRSVSY